MVILWGFDGNVMTIWWRYDDDTMPIWWWYGDDMMVIWCWYDAAMITIRWRYDDNMIIIWWQYYDDMMTVIWWYDADMMPLWCQYEDEESVRAVAVGSSGAGRLQLAISWCRVGCSRKCHQRPGSTTSTTTSISSHCWMSLKGFNKQTHTAQLPAAHTGHLPLLQQPLLLLLLLLDARPLLSNWGLGAAQPSGPRNTTRHFPPLNLYNLTSGRFKWSTGHTKVSAINTQNAISDNLTLALVEVLVANQSSPLSQLWRDKKTSPQLNC